MGTDSEMIPRQELTSAMYALFVDGITVKNGNVGIGTLLPQATLDVDGYIKLTKNLSSPIVCDISHDGSLALTAGYRMCACKSGIGWVYTSDGTTVCTWNPLSPVISNASLDTTTITDGGTVTLMLEVSSPAPVDWLNYSFSGPNGNIVGGGRGVNFTEIAPEVWQYSVTETISEYAPSGAYYFHDVSVENASELQSAVWGGDLIVTVTNSIP